jgi:uncharacterized protein YhdP
LLRDDLTQLTVQSSLRGLESTLPAPLAKKSEEALPLRVEVRATEGGERERIVASLGKLAAVEATRARRGAALELERAAVLLQPAGAQTVRLPSQGIAVQGSLAALDMDAWRAALAGGAGGAPQNVLVDVHLAEVLAYGKRLHGVTLRASSNAQGWTAMIAADALEGELAYHAQEGGRLIARLSRFDVPANASSGRAAPTQPGDLPSVDFVAERFSVRGKDLGRVALAAHPVGDDWRIDTLGMSNESATLHASAWWRGGAKPSTSLDFTLDATDAGKFLERVGYPGLVLGGKAKLEGSVTWQDEPMRLDTASLSGDLRMNAGDGQFLEIEPGIGKLISLMSLQALPRRVALDFRDVFSKGFRFDRIDAQARADAGLMQIGEFRMRGPAAEVQMSGTADLGRETQDLRVRVVPGLGDSASTAIAIVNPVVGITAALAQRVLKNPLGQIFAYEYSVTGRWADPQVARITPVIPPTTQGN